MAGIDMTPGAFNPVDPILVEAMAVLAGKRAVTVPGRLKKAAEIADKVGPWRFQDEDEEALNRALVQGGVDAGRAVPDHDRELTSPLAGDPAGRDADLGRPSPGAGVRRHHPTG